MDRSSRGGVFGFALRGATRAGAVHACQPIRLSEAAERGSVPP